MIDVVVYIVLFFIIVSSLLVAEAKDLLVAVFGLGAVGLFVSLLFLLLHAPDVAMAEATIGSGITMIIFLAAMKFTGRWDDEK